MREPTFLFIGPDKSGSTWLFNILHAHPQCYVPESKDLYFFDRYFDRGPEWYLSHFSRVPEAVRAVGEISHDYLFSEQAACRIRETLPGIKLLTCLRDPVDRTMSQYLYMVRNGLTRKPLSDALTDFPFLVTNSLYYRHLRAYFDLFDASQIKILVFDHLKKSPRGFATEVFDFLGIDFLPDLPYETKSRPASRPRSFALARLTKLAAAVARSAGYEGLVGRVKESTVQRILYKPYADAERPQPSPEEHKILAGAFQDDLAALRSLVDTDLPQWSAARA